MIAAKLKGIVSEDHFLELKVPESIPPGEVEVIILRSESSRKRPTSKLDPNKHPAAGIWADREDIGDTIEFVSKLRRSMEARSDLLASL
ncbi:MAG: hypothetical protein L0177_04945 [Chloroflexi bacterium]|nr:hypothetical protein [Chloroflexota bacterium]